MTQIVELPGGRRASYEVIGEGRPTMMFAGGPGFAAAYMRSHARLFAGTLQSFLIDPPGSGASTAPPEPAGYSPAGHAAFYEEVRRALALEGVVVLGHSFGGTTALTYGALFPGSLIACVAVAALGFSPESDDDAAAESAMVEWEAMLARHAAAPWYGQARPVLDGWTERILAAEDAAEMAEMMGTVLPLYLAHPDDPEVAAAAGELRVDLVADLAAGKAWEGGLWQTIDLRPLLGRIACPTLVVAGAMDFICGPAQAAPIAQAVAGSRLVVIPECGHFPSIEAPIPYRRAVLEFLGGLR
jgi:proline iminopeptidase